MEFDKDFKLALSRLPSKEKDKLILRFLKRDKALAKRVYFEIVSTKNVEECRLEIEKHLIKQSEEISNHFHNPDELVKDIRSLSGDINKHVYTTKDKYGNVSLNILMLNQILHLHQKDLNDSHQISKNKLFLYIISRMFRILINLNSLHTDFHYDFADALTELKENCLKTDHLEFHAKEYGFDINWLDVFNIPEDIDAIYKDIKKKG